MTKIYTSAYSDALSIEQNHSLQEVVEHVNSSAKELINNVQYKGLRLDIQYFLKDSKRSGILHVSTTSNADFSIPNSLSFHENLLRMIPNKYESLAIDGILEVKINYSVKEVDKMNTGSKQNKEPELLEFVPTKPKYDFSQIILPQQIKDEIFEALSVINNRDLIYQEWGFSAIEPTPRSILNFYGAPGTGKSMCAHAVASELNKNILLLNYADIESKYVGEAAKNLKKAFDAAKSHDSVMFFDEADSFLGKRIENVSSGSDQALNSLRSQMLIFLEDFSGVVIFATNLVTNFDKAFESRILNHIKFELPNVEARAEIIEKMIPSKLPKSQEFTKQDFLEASKLIDGLSGREIKTAIQSMLLKQAKINGRNAIFSIDMLKESLLKKKESIEQLKKEEENRIKQRILKKVKETKLETEIQSGKIDKFKFKEELSKIGYIPQEYQAPQGNIIENEVQSIIDYDFIGIDINDMKIDIDVKKHLMTITKGQDKWAYALDETWVSNEQKYSTHLSESKGIFANIQKAYHSSLLKTNNN